MMAFFNMWLATPFMALEFLLFGYLCSLRLKRSEYFWFRLLVLGILEIAAVFLVEFLFFLITGAEFHYGQQTVYDYRVTIFNFVFFLFIYAFTFLTLFVSHKERVSTIFLVSAASFATQHIAYNLFSLFGLFSTLMDEAAADWFLMLLRELFMVGTLVVVGLTAFFNKETVNPYIGNERKKVVVSFLVILVCIGLFRLNNDLPSMGMVASIGFSLYAVTSCALLLFLFFGLLESDKTHAEADAYRELLHEQKSQYELSKKNIELINIKCHDLKHQIKSLRTSDNEKFVREIEHEIMIYDSSVKTGNEVLDVILREKLLQCEAEGITMTCFLKGAAISFMEEMDIYSLFGNLLSNAYESTVKLSDKDRRTIALSGRNVGQMFFLHEENYVEKVPEFVDGLPKTSKDNGDLHGFGMKSMQRIAEKYGGEMVVKCEGDKFSIDFVFPLPSNS